jgi:hypothetical protein
MYLSVEGGRRGVGTEQEVGAPVYSRPEMLELTGRRHLVAVLDGAPAEESHGERHREAELDVVPSVVVAASQVHLNNSKMNLVFFASLTFIMFTSSLYVTKLCMHVQIN